jgi:hypothetical protein
MFHMAAGEKPMIRIDFENAGRSVAILLGSKVIAKKMAQLPPEPDYAGPPNNIPAGVQVEPTKDFIQAANDSDALTPTEMADLQAGKINYYAFGYLLYQDIFGNQHRTGFCCYWNRSPVYENAVISPLYCAEPNYQYAR